MAGRNPGGWNRRLLTWGATIAFAAVFLLLVHSESMPVHHDDHGCATCVIVSGTALLAGLLPSLAHHRPPTPRASLRSAPRPLQPVAAIASRLRPPSLGVVMRL